MSEIKREEFTIRVKVTENIPFGFYLRQAGPSGELEGQKFAVDSNVDGKAVIFHIGERQFVLNTIDVLQDIYRERCDPKKRVAPVYRSLSDDEVLVETDQMCRAEHTEAASREWFPLPKQDIGRRADYFKGGGFCLRRPVKQDEKST